MDLIEPHCRIANTEAGQLQWNYEKSIVMMNSYGGTYRSVNRGQEFSRVYIPVQCIITYGDLLYTEDDEDDYEG